VNTHALQSQDLLVLLKVVAKPSQAKPSQAKPSQAKPSQRWTYAAMGETLSMSNSETYASVKRAQACQ